MKNVIQVIEKEIQRLEMELEEFRKALTVLTEKPTNGKITIEKEMIDIDGVLCDKGAYDYLNQFTEGTDVTMELLKKLTLSNVVDEYISEHKRQRKLDDFGMYGKMTHARAGKNYSGVNWDDTDHGVSFWANVLKYE